MATDASIFTGNDWWTIKNAVAGGGTSPLNTGNQNVAIGATMAKWYGDQITGAMADVQNDTTRLENVQKSMDSIDTWATLSWGSNCIEICSVLGGALDLTGKYTSINFNVTGWSQSNWNAPYPPVSLNRDLSSGYTDPTGLVLNTIYIANDGKPYFYKEPYNGKNCFPATSLKPYFFAPAPSQAQFADWKDDLSDTARDLTQTAQTKQAFLQDLVASLNKYFEWTTSAMERNKHDRNGIVNHF
jgi:hypothetical protein